jgi:diguanylate cyclase (GGDEF)-like protein
MKTSLHVKIATLGAAMALVTALIIFAVVWNNLSKTVHNNITSGLTGASTSFERLLTDLQTDATDQVNLLLQNPAYLLAVNGDDIGAQQTAIQTISSSIDADFVALLNGDMFSGVATSDPAIALPSDIVAQMTTSLNNGGSSFFYNLNGALYYFMTVPNSALNGSKRLLLAYEFDRERVQAISQALSINVAIVLNQKRPQVITAIEQAVSAAQLQQWQLSDSYLALFNANVMLGSQTLYTKGIPLAALNDRAATVYFTINADRVSTNFISLQSTIALISLFTVIIAILLGIYVARIIARPLNQLIDYTLSITQGDYTKELQLKNVSSEFTTLNTAFDTMRSAIKERELTIKNQTQTDALTGLVNRSYLKDIIEQRLRSEQAFQAVGINIRGFRSINDVFGYEVGDAYLQLVAKRTRDLGGIAARVTGGEIIWIPDTPYDIDQLLQLQTELQSNIVINGIAVNTRIVMGVLDCPRDACSPEDLFRRMNIVIDEAHSSKTFLLYYDVQQENRYLRRLSIVSALKAALDSNDGQLYLFYQPKVQLITNEYSTQAHTVQLEALARWQHPKLGMISPDEFVGAAEQAGFIYSLTRWVLKTAVNDLLEFKRTEPSVKLAVNISADDVLDASLLPYLQTLLSDNNLSADAILLELTERVIVKNPETSIERLQTLKDAGFKIAIDDFGTGYSSLSYLAKLPIDILKIDKSFVIDLPQKPAQQAICKTILTLASNLHIDVVAEGIEDEQSMHILTTMGCKWGQGFYICKPMHKDKVPDWIQNHLN